MAGSDQGFSAYWGALRTHKVLVAVITLATVVAAFAWLQLRPDTYQASAQILVSPLDQSDDTFLGLDLLRDSGDPTRTVETAATLLYTPSVADQVAQEMGPGWSQKDVTDAVKIEPEGQSNILAVTAEADQPETAVRLANLFAEAALDDRRTRLRDQLDEEITELNRQRDGLSPGDESSAAALTERIAQLTSLSTKGDPTVALSRPATPPEGPEGIGAAMLLPVALIVGLLLGSGTALLLTIASPSVRDEDELNALWPLPVLARVPNSPGLDGIPIENSQSQPPAVREAYRTVVAQLDPGPDSSVSILVTSPSSSDGKTTTALALAASFAAAGRLVILADLDLRRPGLAKRIGVEGLHGSAKPERPINASQSLREQLQDVPGCPGLFLYIPENSGDEGVPANSLNRQVPALLEKAKQIADVVVIDSPPIGEISDALSISYHVDLITMVVRPGRSNRKTLSGTRDLLTRVGHVPVGYILTGTEPTGSSLYYSQGMASTRPKAPQKPSQKSSETKDLGANSPTSQGPPRDPGGAPRT